MKIIVADGYTTNPGDTSWDGLAALGELTIYDRTDPADVVHRLQGADILITNKTRLPAELIVQFDRLKFISVLATGYDVIDVSAAAAKNIVVSNVPHYSTASVAQHVFAGLLALLNRPESHHQAVERGQWCESPDFSFWLNQQIELAGKKLGIIGLGQIGSAVARLGQAFGMKVLAVKRNQQTSIHSNSPTDSLEGVERLELEDLLRQADVVSLHCPLTSENRLMMNEHRIGLMKSTAILINTARGGLVDEQRLANALNQGKIGGAFVDVVSAEPMLANNPLLQAKHCLITPHLAWATVESRRRLLKTTTDNVAAFLAGSPINRIV